MSTIDEANIGATIVALKAAAAAHQRLPVSVQLVEHDETLSAHAWRRLAVERLEQAEAAKARRDTIHLSAARGGEALAPVP